MKFAEIPALFRKKYSDGWGWSGHVQLIKLGPVKHSENPYFALNEKQVENKTVRWLGKLPESAYGHVTVEREDGATWSICLSNFEHYEVIREIEDWFEAMQPICEQRAEEARRKMEV